MKQIIFTALVALFATSAFAQTDLEKEKEMSAQYLTKMAQEPGAVIYDTVVVRPIFATTGKSPQVTDTVTVSYHLTDREGKIIEDSIVSDRAVAFPLAKLIKCWQVAIPKMTVGSHYKISCPSDTAYGDKGTSDGVIKGGAALTFRVTLFGIKEP